MPAKRLIPTAAVLIAVLSPTVALAQNNGSAGASSFQQGYGGARNATSTQTTGSTRDANGNRLIVDGIIQSGASSYARAAGGVGSSYSGSGQGAGQGGSTTIGGSTAIGNNLNVVVQGNHNTVIVNSTQVNNGAVTAGTNLNGTPRIP